MKTIAITAAVILLSATTLHAQTDTGDDRGGRHAGKHRGDPLTHLTEKLNLSDDQVVEVAVIFEESRAQHHAVQENVREEHCAIREITFNELATVLSDEQLVQFEDLHNQRKYQGGRQHGMPKFADCEI